IFLDPHDVGLRLGLPHSPDTQDNPARRRRTGASDAERTGIVGQRGLDAERCNPCGAAFRKGSAPSEEAGNLMVQWFDSVPTLLYLALAAAAGGLTSFLHACKRGWIKNNKHSRKAALEVTGGLLTG